MTETREAIETRLTDLHRQRGAALLAGKPFDNALIVEQHEALAALDDVAAEESRRKRAAAEDAYQKQFSEQCTKLALLVADDLADVKECEDASRKLAAAISRRLKRNSELARLTHAVSGGPVPTILHFNELMDRIGGWVGAILGAVVKPRNKIGGLQWGGTTRFPADTKSWADAERAAYDKHITPLTKE